MGTVSEKMTTFAVGGLRSNLIGAIVTSTGALVLTLMLIEDPLIEFRETERVRRELVDTAERIVAEWEAVDEIDQLADLVGAETGSHITIVDSEGRVRGDTAWDGVDLAAKAEAGTELIEEARRNGEAFRVERVGARQVRVARAGTGPTGTTWVVQVKTTLAAIQSSQETMRELVVVAGFLAILFSGILAAVLSRTMVRPMAALTEAADAFATGDLSRRMRSSRNDELGRLGRSLDRMADQLQERLETLGAERARLQTVLDAMVESVFVADERGRIVMTNAALDRFVGTNVTGRTAVEAIRSPDLQDAVRLARRGTTSSVDFTVQVADESRELAAQVAPLPDQAGVVAVLHDVTEMKMSDRIRRDFVANASHELRTPLTAIRGFAETLRDGALHNPDVAGRFLQKILMNARRLQRLVGDLVVLSRAESPEQRYELEAVSVAPFAIDVISGLESQSKKKKVQVDLDAEDPCPPARTSDKALDQILVNLIDNAIKYTDEGGRVTVRIRYERPNVVLQVSNTGQGIEEHHLERIFERFYRIDEGRSREFGGTGLGLAIVKHLCAAIDAQIDVTSELGVGTVFSIRFPEWQVDSDPQETLPTWRAV
ncbi:MAG: ATP-binding protein [Myxococcota bacterium]